MTDTSRPSRVRIEQGTAYEILRVLHLDRHARSSS
jgi:hypothetical protein